MPFSDLVECIENYKLLSVNTMCSIKKEAVRYSWKRFWLKEPFNYKDTHKKGIRNSEYIIIK